MGRNSEFAGFNDKLPGVKDPNNPGLDECDPIIGKA
jgi:hypothetical protein